MNSPQVTVIIPVFNDERVRIAVESVAMQHVAFGVEILVVNDGSTDNTPKVLNDLQRDFPALRIITNFTNLGKGASFRRAYQEAKGKYVNVLDSDDFFIYRKKLQVQFDEMERDSEIFAVATNTLISYVNGRVDLLSRSMEAVDYSYIDFINNEFYHHTSAYLIRKVDEEIPIEFDTVTGLRGDTACMYFHGFHSRLGVKFLPIVGSVYNLHGQGLWSSLSTTEQTSLVLEVFTAIRDFVIIDPDRFEYQILDTKIEKLQLTRTEDSAEVPRGIERTSFLQHCHSLYDHRYSTEKFPAPSQTNSSTLSNVIDSYYQALGSIFAIEAGLPQHQKSPKTG